MQVGGGLSRRVMTAGGDVDSPEDSDATADDEGGRQRDSVAVCESGARMRQIVEWWAERTSECDGSCVPM
jgi:hypothetical protein